MAIDINEEMALLFQEALTGVEKELALEDEGWIKLGAATNEVISDNDRRVTVAKARLYAMRDPMARQAVRLWTDYTFGPGMTWRTEDKKAKQTLNNFWKAQANSPVLSSRGQRKSSDKLLIDGEVFLALFLGTNGKATIRRIDPLEITELISDPDDLEDVRFYKREWTDTNNQPHKSYYRSVVNQDNQPCKDHAGEEVKADEEAIVYHLAINNLGQRGNSLLLPAVDWIKLHRQYAAARAAIMLAAARWLWKSKVQGGQTAVEAVKSKMEEELPAAASVLIENAAVDTNPLNVNTNARNAYDDDRMLKLQICSAVGIPEQYFGDISIGNLATAKTVELPMVKMFQSYQKIWEDTYDEIDTIILKKAKVWKEDTYIDRDFPPIAPKDAIAISQAITQFVNAFPQFADSRDVMQAALLSLGIQNTAEVLDDMLGKNGEERQESAIRELSKALKRFKEEELNVKS